MVVKDSPNLFNPYVFVRGNQGRHGKEIPRRFLRVLSPGGEAKPFADGSGRLDLAKAIASPDNPLTARVMVNRIWHDHFGVGLVPTPSDFGTRGDAPSNPELLDFLARKFVESGWSIKAMHRLILLSNTYQAVERRPIRGGRRRPEQPPGLEAEPSQARLRGPPRRHPRRLRPARPDPRRPARRAVRAQVLLDPADRLRLRRPLRPRPDLPHVRLPQPRHQRPAPGDDHRPAAGPLPAQQPVPARTGQAPRRPRRHQARRRRRPDSPPLPRPLRPRSPKPHEVEVGRKFVESRPKVEGAPSPWEEYAQVLLMTNEFTFID